MDVMNGMPTVVQELSAWAEHGLIPAFGPNDSIDEVLASTLEVIRTHIVLTRVEAYAHAVNKNAKAAKTIFSC